MFSHADYHWDDQMRHFPGYERWLALVPDLKRKLPREMVNNNPHMAAYDCPFAHGIRAVRVTEYTDLGHSAPEPYRLT